MQQHPRRRPIPRMAGALDGGARSFRRQVGTTAAHALRKFDVRSDTMRDAIVRRFAFMAVLADDKKGARPDVLGLWKEDT